MIATRFPDPTLYVLTSESNQVACRIHGCSQDKRLFFGSLESGRAAILLVGAGRQVLATYNWGTDERDVGKSENTRNGREVKSNWTSGFPLPLTSSMRPVCPWTMRG